MNEKLIRTTREGDFLPYPNNFELYYIGGERKLRKMAGILVGKQEGTLGRC